MIGATPPAIAVPLLQTLHKLLFRYGLAVHGHLIQALNDAIREFILIGERHSEQAVEIVGHFPGERLLALIHRHVFQEGQNWFASSLCSSEFLLGHGLPCLRLVAEIRAQDQHYDISLLDLSHARML
ncbi:hypothetical protein D3C77_234200 [compost metagenome]